jgi:hypothetical protein
MKTPVSRRALLAGAGALFTTPTIGRLVKAAPASMSPPAPFKIHDHRGQSQKQGSSDNPLANAILSKYPDNVFQMLLGIKDGSIWKSGYEPTAVTTPAYGGSLYPDVWPTGIRCSASSDTFMADRIIELMQPTPPIIANIPNAKSGSPLANQLPGSRIWQVAQERLQKAKDIGGVMGCVVWDGCQGDARTLATANAVAARLVDWIGQHRFENGDAPLILWQIGDPPPNWKTVYAWWSTVQDQIEDAYDQIDNCILLRSKGFDTFEGVHWTTESARRAGEMEALAYFAATHGASA